MTLGQMGGVQATPQVQGLEQGLDAAVGPVTPESRKPLMKTPVGDYYVPTQEQREDKATDRAIDKAGKLKDVTDPVVTIDIRGKPVRVRQSQLDNILPKLYPDARLDKTVNKETGDVTKVWYDGQGNELRRVVEPAIGGRAASPAGKEYDYEAELRAEKDSSTERTTRIDQWMPWAFSQLGVEQQYATPEEKAKALKIAEDKVDTAMKQEFDREVSRRKNAAQKTQQGAKPGSMVVRASSLQSELERGNAERRRMNKPPFTMQEFRKKLTERGYTIDDKN
jgi:hypothetical protein